MQTQPGPWFPVSIDIFCAESTGYINYIKLKLITMSCHWRNLIMMDIVDARTISYTGSVDSIGSTNYYKSALPAPTLKPAFQFVACQ